MYLGTQLSEPQPRKIAEMSKTWGRRDKERGFVQNHKQKFTLDVRHKS